MKPVPVPTRDQTNYRENVMAVVRTSIEITPETAQHGVQHVENVISPPIGRLYVAKFPKDDKTEADSLVRIVP